MKTETMQRCKLKSPEKKFDVKMLLKKEWLIISDGVGTCEELIFGLCRYGGERNQIMALWFILLRRNRRHHVMIAPQTYRYNIMFIFLHTRTQQLFGICLLTMNHVA